jgi:hypothetical protein
MSIAREAQIIATNINIMGVPCRVNPPLLAGMYKSPFISPTIPQQIKNNERTQQIMRSFTGI